MQRSTFKPATTASAQGIPHLPFVSLTPQRGATLIEVLVAILLVAFGILAMAALQVNATRVAKASEFRAMGALLVADLADRMRANREGVLYRATEASPFSNQYAFTTPYPYSGDATVTGSATACNTTSVTCTATQMAQYDLLEWRKAVSAALPGGWVRVSNVDTSAASSSDPSENAVDIWLMWVEIEGTPMGGDDLVCPSDAVATPPDGEPASTVTPRCMYFRVNL